MYIDEYASVQLNDWQLNRSAPADLGSEPIVHGWVLTCGDELWPQKLAHFDEIEGIDDEDERDVEGVLIKSVNYRRVTVEVELESETVGEGIGTAGEKVQAFIYERQECDTSQRIESGDWLQRPK